MVREAKSGAAGLALLGAEPVDVLLTDEDMPGLTGWDVAILVKAMCPHLPVVLLTGGDEVRSTNQKKRALMDAILQKPFRFDQLQALIGTVTMPSRSLFVMRSSRAAARVAAQN